MNETIHEIRKSKKSKIIAKLTDEYGNAIKFDIRIWYEDENNVYQATQKGIQLPVEKFEDFWILVRKIRDYLVAKNLYDEDKT